MNKDNIMSKFLPEINKQALDKAKDANNYDDIYDILAQPLHEELYRRQSFSFLDELSAGQQVLLSYDYVRTQVGQGGFIQFIQNGYISLLPQMVIWLDDMHITEMAAILDDVLKVYVLNRELLDRSTLLKSLHGYMTR